LFETLVSGLRGSMVATPSTLMLYRYAPGGSGADVNDQTPFSALVMTPV
jgi:hypothetical protein